MEIEKLESSLGSEVVANFQDLDDGDDEVIDPDDREDPFDTDETSEDDDLMPERLIENNNQQLS